MNQYDYIDAGLRVFSLYAIKKDGTCGCDKKDCDAVGKHPRASNWQHTPEWSNEQLDVMEQTGQFKTGFGVLAKGLLVVDIDPRNGGDEAYDKLGIDLESQSGFVVNTGGGGRHIYFKAPADTALLTHLNDYKGIDFKSSGYVVGCGSMHASGSSYEAKSGHPCDIGEAPQKLIDLLIRKNTYRTYDGSTQIDVSRENIVDMLCYHKGYDDYEQWIQCGMAIHHATSGDGFDLWDKWSQESEKYNPHNMDRKWHSFGKSANPVTIATLKHYAQQGGYVEPVTFDIENDAESLPPSYEKPAFDLLRPPSFVGELTEYINSQCRYPRERLAVAASLSAMGNIGGLIYEDQAYGVTSNQFIFCVAGSATGKEAVQQAQNDIHRAAGLAPAVHGVIKSEQEIIRNLVNHQSALYTIDEMGLVLQKIQNARKRGGAAYLEGVIGTLMSAYSKAGSFMLLSGDVREDVKKQFANEIAKLKRIQETEGEDLSETIQAIQAQIQMIDQGLERPFLSLIGFTTPVTFNELMDYEQSANGFFGRALVIQEKDTNPKAKKMFKAPEMSVSMKMRIAAICNGGAVDSNKRRIEHRGKRIPINTTQEAIDRLESIQDELHNYAEIAKSMALEAIPRRSFELILKVSLCLAIADRVIADRVRTLEHVEWAYSLIMSDLEGKMALISANIAQEDKRSGDELIHRILSILDKETHHTTGVLHNRCKRFKKSDVDQACDILIKQNKIRAETVNSKRGKTQRLYLV